MRYWLNSIRFIFFGNYFYGICAVALSIETAYQQSIPLNSVLSYLFIFSITVLYYTHAYLHHSHNAPPVHHARANWYYKNQKLVFASQLLLTGISFFLVLIFLNGLQPNFKYLPIQTWLLLLLALLALGMYYGGWNPGKSGISLRHTGWLKPLVIAFAWACCVSFLPMVFYDLSNKSSRTYSWVTLFLFIKNWLYISVLCVLFDIKDYATDANQALKTFVVQYGLRKTIFNFVIPVCVLAHCFLLLTAYSRGFHASRIIFNTIPFILLIIVAWSMHRRKSILYYLAVIDGLMLIKALCGIAGSLF
ncbi:MAG: hypothetical protein K2X26_00695 [Chitinophagaceae bacterium]|nr:hypothetical protein [Chitinophagaceae bacterium]